MRCLTAILTLLTLLTAGLVTDAAAATTPTLTLTPERGRCGEPITAHGARFTPGARVDFRGPQLTAGPDLRGRSGLPPADVTADAAGAFTVSLLPCNVLTEGAGVVGFPYRFSADAATALFTVAAPPCFAETGFCVGGPRGLFLAYWQGGGLTDAAPPVSFQASLAQFGYPISAEFQERLEDGQVYTVQYFERVRMEYHPENDHPGDVRYAVLLGQFGRHFHPADPPTAPQRGATYFAVTGHSISPDILAYWQAHGGLEQFGYPISAEFAEQLGDGQTYTAQYFERARFERHPENDPPYNILLGQFGRQILASAPTTR